MSSLERCDDTGVKEFILHQAPGKEGETRKMSAIAHLLTFILARGFVNSKSGCPVNMTSL